MLLHTSVYYHCEVLHGERMLRYYQFSSFQDELKRNLKKITDRCEKEMEA